MKRLLLFFFLINTTTCFSQVGVAVLELMDANVHINTNGMLFYNNSAGFQGYETPPNSGNHVLYNSALWISGVDSENNLRTTAITYCQDNIDGFCEIYPGPLKIEGTASTDMSVFNNYNRFWFISRDQVETHTEFYQCVNDPDCNIETEFPNGYSIPQDILDWPAHGESTLDLPEDLAPFVDVNSNGNYEPSLGDYPSFMGDKAVYMIANDMGIEHIESGGAPFGVEIHTMLYYYLDNNPALSRTIYVHQDIINRSQRDYHDVYLGIFNDFDLGNHEDDFVGTDVENAFIYAYNGDGFDESSSSGVGYGDDLPMFACKILAGPMLDPDGVDNTGVDMEYGNFSKGWNDGIIDNERMGLSSSVHLASEGAPYGVPTNSTGFYNISKSFWINNVPITFGGYGYDPNATDVLTAKYFYPGMSDPFFHGTEGVDPNYGTDGGWTEPNAGFNPGDRRMSAHSGPSTLNSGQTQSIDYVYVFARQSDDIDSDLYDILTEHVNIASQHPDSLPTGVTTSVRQIHPKKIGFGIYPNPATDTFTLTLSGNETAAYRIYNVLGAQVESGVTKAGQTTVNVTGLKKGLYLVNVTLGNLSATQKLIVE